MGRRTLTTLALTGALLALPASAAFAHDCFVANRSAQGAAGASHSGRWVSFSIAEIFQFEFGVPEANVGDAVAEAVAAGVPEALATRTDKVIGEGANGRYADGKGMEHFSESPLVATLAEIAINWGGSF